MNLLNLDFPVLVGASCGPENADLFAADGEADPYALQLCAGCPVRDACLEWALERREKFGIWGGMTVQERARLMRKQTRGRETQTCIDCPAQIPLRHRRCEVHRLEAKRARNRKTETARRVAAA